MRCGALVLALLFACEAAPTSSREPSNRPPEPAPQPPTASPLAPDVDAAKPQPSESAPKLANPANALQPAAPSLCVRMCEAQGQARAVAAAVVSRECRARCKNPSDAPCSAAEARARVESVSMNRRAPKVWAELANPAFYCGYQDAFTRGLRTAAAANGDVRRAALGRALASDPYPLDTCPTAAEVPLDAVAAEAMAACGLDEPAAGWHQDVDAASYLALRAVRVRLEAASLYAGDRKILLQTLILSTALERER